jgi:molecular chaperone DnaK
VTFDIDANGIVHVSAKDLGTGKEQKIRIESSSGLSESDIEKMVREAEAHAEEDRRERERVEARNEADSLLYATEKSVSEFGDKVSASDKQNIQNAMQDLKKAMEGNDTELIKQKTEALKQASYKLSEEIYKNASAQQAASGQNPYGEGGTSESSGPGSSEGPSSGTSGGDDFDYKVVDDDDKK